VFFLFGMPRSGTTLLAQCLDAHPDLVVPHETDFIVPMGFLFDRIRDPALGRRMIEQLILNSPAFAGSLGEFLDADAVRAAVHDSDYHPAAILRSLYARVAAAGGARLAGDKSPNDINFARILVKTGALAPDFKILHIVRDIRDLMVSLNRTGWVAELDRYFPRLWCQNNLYLQALFGDDPARYLRLRYEDLAADPAGEVGRACAFLGVDFRPAQLAPESRHVRYRGMDQHENLFKPISSFSVGRHGAELDAATRLNYETQAQEALRAFGYL
jgi:hypothetical protein